MLKSRRVIIGTGLLVSALLVGAIGANAQQARQYDSWMGRGMHMGDMAGCPMMGQMPGSGMHHGMMMHGPAAEGHLAYLKAELGITEAQTAAWTGYVSAVKARMSTMQGTHQTMMQTWQNGTAVARLDAHTKSMESMVESLKVLRPATEALYAVLTADQKLKADQLLGMGCCMM